MLTVDFIGLLLTVGLIGPRYPHCVLFAATINLISQIAVALFLQGDIHSIVAAGAFGGMEVSHVTGFKNAVLAISPLLANYIAGKAAGGMEFESTSNIINPFAMLKHPIAVINIRFCIASSLFTLLGILFS
ncbi:MAG TPA: hypothetical protein PKA28_02060 [Methylomusa anaerophila]|uniref:Uncharacterized protein n=1 Tax=Methylomusa anaerophila TaxID=1930071 RepID=A0A348APF1_9FIRM|nr:hypothetical protein [Methylomusa anaerophila]BBB92949.1 hypothetical protein MAMMFC1_03657 [Methylomusa anaerophila]HML87217.1 hypothetical protein [Methylomusa anaerophila]